jgi:hypothetical protein
MNPSLEFLGRSVSKEKVLHTWICWIKQVVQSGRVCINIHGVNGYYVRTYKGLRQVIRCPQFFLIKWWRLWGVFLNLAKNNGHLRGLAQNLVQGGVTHLQYADDTILLIENDEESTLTVKLILYCFEAMSGLKINYQKSEVFGVGVEQVDLARVAMMLNCEVGSFPMKYLGLPISGDKIMVKDLDFVLEKLVKKLANGCSIQASSGGKAILIDSCLDNLATYAMSFFLLYEQAHAKMDSVRARLFW